MLAVSKDEIVHLMPVASSSSSVDFCSWSIVYLRWMIGDGAVQGMVNVILAAHAG